MRKDVIIHIIGRPKYDGCESEEIELTTDGRLVKKNETYFVIYKESELTGMNGSTTMLKIEDDRVTLRRNGGSYVSHMIFQKGERHFGIYNTDFGSMTVAISARDIKNNINDNGGELFIDYAIEVNNVLTGENIFNVDIRERESFPS